MFILPIDQDTYLKLLLPKDADILVPALKKNQNHLKQWLIWAVELPSVSDYREKIIPAWLQKFADNNGFEAAIFYKQNLAGMVGLHYIDWSNKTTEIGYWISKSYEGKGIMTKTVEVLTNYCFDELQLNRVLIRAVTENKKSCAIPVRLGFTKEGITRSAQLLHGNYYDLVNYSLLQADRKL
ncbi:GNAT family N-acetyltransferase [Microbacteriaceae bacterium 4G12]